MPEAGSTRLSGIAKSELSITFRPSRATYAASNTKAPGSSREMEKLIVCEYGVLILSSMPAVIANPKSGSSGNWQGNFTWPPGVHGLFDSNDVGIFDNPVNLGDVRAVSTPAGLVNWVEIPNARVFESALVASAFPMRS